ncbi:hypothetical protein HOLleu_05805 [Holothuria leucospilota]|uniref:Uncharacterized protein n=1 Tax=Holothuria leucospilota TaxID=206669 RepID=A0A9Q1CKL1_HOLLE|nr:hypothetical protein HOLleu_05805 [Holothuria leucospilota]
MPMKLTCMDLLSVEPDVIDTRNIQEDTRVLNFAWGPLVLAKNVKLREKHKLADRWEKEVHVLKQPAKTIPVFRVEPESGEVPQRKLHCKLLPCPFPRSFNQDAPATKSRPPGQECICKNRHLLPNV